MANRQLVNSVGSLEQDNLIARLFPPALTTAVYLNATAGTTYARGTIVTVADGVASPLAAALTATTPVYILCDDTTSDEGGEVAVAVYSSGNFNIDAVVTDGTYELTAEDKDILRIHNIILTDMLDA